MAKWENLKFAVAAVVKTNGNKEITGANMQAVLNSIINAVGDNAGFAGIATPTTNPSGIPDGPTFYIATQGGTYSYFPTDGQSTPATIQDGVICVLYNQGNGLWVVTTTPMSIANGSVTTGKLATGAVTAAKIADGAIGTDKISNGAVTASKIANESISQSKLQFDAVGADNIRDNAITTGKIAQGAVGNMQLATNSVTAEKIGDGSITTSKITNGAVTGEKIANGTITSAKIADGTITGNEIAPNSIESSNLNYGAVDNEILADGAVTTDKLANGAVTNDKIADGTIDGYLKIAESSIRWENMDQGSVGKDTLQDDAVIESKIKDGAVTEYKLGTHSVSQRSIINGAVTEAKLANNSVTGNKIANGEITNEKIANGTITSAKIADGTITVNEIAPNSIESSNLSYGAVDNEILADGAVTTDKLAPFAVDTGNIENKAVTKGKLDDDVVAILDEVDNKANIDGFYDTMGVGTARNLLGKTSVVDTFFRKTIGVGVTMGNGYVDGVKGNSQAWNQLVPNRDEKSLNKYFRPIHNGTFPCVKGHKYYIKIYAKSDVTNDISFLIGTPTAFGSDSCIVTSPTTDYKAYSYIREFYLSTGNNNSLKLSSAYGGIATFKDCQVIDLSIMFGVGNEPATPLVFEEWLASNIGDIDYYPYNAGELLSVKMVGIKSTGTTFGTKTKDIPITGITGNHLGTRSTIFPNGMRGVGNGYDEINGNSAIVRIASVKVSELEWVFVEDSVFVANIPTRKYGNGIIVMCDKYASQPRGVDKGIYAHTITNSVLVTDTAYQSAAAFKTAMGDATILYELEVPIEYTDLMDEQENDFSLPIGIEVEPLGTLETLPQNTEGEALTMCAPTLSMQFSIDAAKILTDELPNEYRTNADDKANWNKFLAIMNEKLGGAMGGTISVDDAAVGHGLDFTFAAAQAENNRDVEPIEE